MSTTSTTPCDQLSGDPRPGTTHAMSVGDINKKLMCEGGAYFHNNWSIQGAPNKLNYLESFPYSREVIDMLRQFYAQNASRLQPRLPLFNPQNTTTQNGDAQGNPNGQGNQNGGAPGTDMINVLGMNIDKTTAIAGATAIALLGFYLYKKSNQ